MTLTTNERTNLLNATIELLSAHNDMDFSSREILLALNNESVSSQVLTNILNNYRNDDNAIIMITNTKPYRFQVIRLEERIMVTGYEKNKNLLVFYNEDKTKSFSFDFNTHAYTTNSFKVVKSTDTDIERLIHALKVWSDMKEWLFSYPDLLDDIDQIKYIEDDCPKGYINWLRTNNLLINTETIKIYKAWTKAPNLNYKQLKNILRLGNRGDYLLSHLDIYKTLMRIINTTMKNCEFEQLDSITWYLRNIIDLLEEMGNNVALLDPNRDLETNNNNLRANREKEANKILTERLQTLNFLNGYTENGYIVVVPQNVTDLQNEGRQQNNCVGHFYNRSIARGDNLIYFLRKETNPIKSVVTCRYNVGNKKTVEHRIVNNMDTNNTQETIIKHIDKIINDTLK